MTLADREAAVLFHTYKRLPLHVEHGEGVYLFTADGKRYLDMFFRPCRERARLRPSPVVDAIAVQAAKYTHLSNYYLQEPQVRFAELLTRACGVRKGFPCKQRHGSHRGNHQARAPVGIVSRQNRRGFHDELFSRPDPGGALAHGQAPVPRGVRAVPRQLHSGRIQRSGVAGRSGEWIDRGVVLEFIQGEGGVRPASGEFAATLEACAGVTGSCWWPTRSRRASGGQERSSRSSTMACVPMSWWSPSLSAEVSRSAASWPARSLRRCWSPACTARPSGKPRRLRGRRGGDPGNHGGRLMQRAGELGGVLLAGLRSLAERHRGLVREVAREGADGGPRARQGCRAVRGRDAGPRHPDQRDRPDRPEVSPPADRRRGAYRAHHRHAGRRPGFPKMTTALPGMQRGERKGA